MVMCAICSFVLVDWGCLEARQVMTAFQESGMNWG